MTTCGIPPAVQTQHGKFYSRLGISAREPSRAKCLRLRSPRGAASNDVVLWCACHKDVHLPPQSQWVLIPHDIVPRRERGLPALRQVAAAKTSPERVLWPWVVPLLDPLQQTA